MVLAFWAPIWYYLDMSSIVGKKQDGKTYYYLVTSGRVDGKPRIIDQQYLGSAAEVMAKLAGTPAGDPVRTAHKKFGDLAAVWSMLERLNVVDTIDAVAPRRSDAGASVGTYMALATANRVVAPCSKLAFADWWATTAGPRWVKLPAAALDHRKFWKAMDRLDETDLRLIEARLGKAMVAEFDLDLSALALDMTNFATFIDSGNERAPIAQRGKAKQKRVDLRLVALALVVTRDGGIPLISHTYPGDRPDVTQFTTVVEELIARYRNLTDGVESLTVVYDAGQNSAANHARIETAGIGFVGSLPPSQHLDLLAVPATDYQNVDAGRYPGLTAVDTTVTALGVTRRAVMTHSPTLHAAQSRGFDQTLAKAGHQLGELADLLERGKTRRERASGARVGGARRLPREAEEARGAGHLRAARRGGARAKEARGARVCGASGAAAGEAAARAARGDRRPHDQQRPAAPDRSRHVTVARLRFVRREPVLPADAGQALAHAAGADHPRLPVYLRLLQLAVANDSARRGKPQILPQAAHRPDPRRAAPLRRCLQGGFILFLGRHLSRLERRRV